jgi:hypothetical protein
MERWMPTLVAMPLVGFVLYRRFARAFRRQPVAAGRMLPRVVVLSLLSALFLAALPTKLGLAAAGIGALIGTTLALFSLGRTQIEVTPEGRFFTPHKWTELVIMTLFLGRLVARMLTTFEVAQSIRDGRAASNPALQRSPLTLALFCILAAYYVVYYVGLLRRARALPAPVKNSAA